MTPDDDALRSLPAGVALSWGLESKPSRGPKRELTVPQIVSAAVDIADDGGLQAVTMNRVAGSLGVTAMALYRYIASKDDLVLLMQDAVVARFLPDSPPSDWRSGLRAFVRATVDVFKQHPWFGDIAVSGVPVTKNMLRLVDWALASMASLPLAPNEKVSILLLTNSFARAWGLLERDMGHAVQAGLSPEDFSGTSYSAALRTLVTPMEFPHLHPLIASGAYTDGSGLDDPFEFGLQRIFDGIEKYVEGRTAALNADRPSAERPASRR